MPWRRDARHSDEALKQAEQLRDRALEQRHRVEAITPRVDAAVRSLRRTGSDNGFLPMIENVMHWSSK